MNYIDQINMFWILDAEHLFSGTETRLYFYLLKLSNSLYWKNPLTNADGYTAAQVGISVNPLKTARNRLQQAGLITFKPGGKGSRDKCVYYIVPAQQVLKVSDSDTSGNKVSESDTFSTKTLTPYAIPGLEKPDDISKHKLNETKEEVVPAEPPPPKLVKRGKKEKPAQPPEPFWDLLVKTWFDFNEEKFRGRPSFGDADPRHFKKIIERLKYRAKVKELDWNEETCVRQLRHFLKHAYQDSWLRGHFLLRNLLEQFDSIVLHHRQTAVKSSEPQPAQPQAGSMGEELRYLFGRFQEGSLDESLIREDHYHHLVTRSKLPVGTMARFDAPTPEEQMKLAVLDYFKSRAS